MCGHMAGPEMAAGGRTMGSTEVVLKDFFFFFERSEKLICLLDISKVTSARFQHKGYISQKTPVFFITYFVTTVLTLYMIKI